MDGTERDLSPGYKTTSVSVILLISNPTTIGNLVSWQQVISRYFSLGSPALILADHPLQPCQETKHTMGLSNVIRIRGKLQFKLPLRSKKLVRSKDCPGSMTARLSHVHPAIIPIQTNQKILRQLLPSEQPLPLPS